MPLYEYRCTACDRLTEKRQKFSDPEITECPYCGGKLERTITAPAVQFKGGGWYADGYGSKKPAATGGGDAASGGSEGKSGSESKGGSENKGGSESKGEAKPRESAAAPAAASAAPAATPSGTPSTQP